MALTITGPIEASRVINTPAGNIAATEVQAAINELDSEKSSTTHTHAEYVNQNAFSNVAVSGQTTIAADAATDTLTFAAGNNITITTDSATDTITIASSGSASVTATDVTITDTGDYYTSLNVEGALQEIGLDFGTVEANKADKYYPTIIGSTIIESTDQYHSLKIKSTHASAVPILQLRDAAETGFDLSYDKTNAAFSVNKTVAGAYDSTLLALHSDFISYKGNSIWHAGNDGPSSGLNADLWDGYHMPTLVADKVLKVNVAGDGLEWGEGGGAVPVGLVAGDAGEGFINYNGLTAASGEFDGSTTAPTGTNRLNFGGYFYATRVYNAYYNDYAEYFKKEGELEYGDVVAKKPGTDIYIKSRQAYDKLVVGVYSDSYGHCLGGDGLDDVDTRYASIGLAGRVDVKVVGEVEEGDLLVASDVPGVAMKCVNYTPGSVIGKALENKICAEIQKVKMLIVNL